MNISIREAQMSPTEEHKELLGTSQVYIHSSNFLNDIRKAVDIVNKMEPEAIKRISDIIEDASMGPGTLGQYLHPVLNNPSPEEKANVSGVIKLNIEAIKKLPECQTPEGFANKIADVIIHESEHKHDVEMTGTSSEAHPEDKQKQFQVKLEQSQPAQPPMMGISSRDIDIKTASPDLTRYTKELSKKFDSGSIGYSNTTRRCKKCDKLLDNSNKKDVDTGLCMKCRLT